MIVQRNLLVIQDLKMLKKNGYRDLRSRQGGTMTVVREFLVELTVQITTESTRVGQSHGLLHIFEPIRTT